MHRKIKDQRLNPRMGLGLLCAAVCTWVACNNLALLHHPDSEQKTDTPELSLPYKTVLTDRSNNNARLPLIIAMHGLGGTPDDMIRTLSDLEVPARVIAPYGLFPFGMQGGASWYANAIPSRTSDPQLIAEDMNYAADKLAQFISKAMIENHGKRIIFSGATLYDAAGRKIAGAKATNLIVPTKKNG